MPKRRCRTRPRRTLMRSSKALCAIAAALFAHASLATTIAIDNVNTAGVGFNDGTPATPVGGNNGTTLGQQRLNVFQKAAGQWSRLLNSNVTIKVQASMVALTCTATSATL